MSKIKDLINDEKNILVFDVDGVLSTLEWGAHNHYAMNDDAWNIACAEGMNAYNEERVIKKMQDFLRKRNNKKIYVITTIGHNNEGEFKKDFVNKYYNIPRENVYYVKDNMEKKEKLKEIRKLYPELEDYRIIMVDDTVDILNDIMENTNYSTVHISSFLDI